MQNAVMATQSLSPEADEARGLSAELSTLSKRQYEALQKSPYERMSPQAVDAYDRRRVRIVEIWERLEALRANGSEGSPSRCA